MRMVKLFLALILLILAFWCTGSMDLLVTLRELDTVFLVPFLLWSIPLILVSVIKWRVFLRFYGSDESLWRLSALYLVGYFFSIFLPSQVGGDAVRSWKLGTRVGQREALSATILERYTGLVTMIAVSAGCIVCYQGVPIGVQFFIFFVVFGLGFGSVLAMSSKVLKFVSKYWQALLGAPLPFQSKVLALQTGLRSVGRSPGTLFTSFLLSLMFFCLAVFNVVIAAYSIGWTDVSIAGLFTVLPLILVVGSLPITPSGLGLQEGAFLFFLQGLGATPAQALAVALLLRAKWIVLALLGGVVWMFMNYQMPSRETSTS